MTNFGGAFDLSRLAAGATTPASIVAVDEALLREYLETSKQVPILVLIYVPSDAISLAVMNRVSDALTAQGGKIGAIKIDANAQPQLAQAFGVEAVPTLLALIAGQPAPLAQGEISTEQLDAMIKRVLEVAAQNGVSGTLGEPQPVADPIVTEVQRLIDTGDLAAAEQRLESSIAENPANQEYQGLLEQVLLLIRITGQDIQQVAASEASDLDSILNKADAVILTGDVQQSFELLLTAFVTATDEQRVVIRQRLLSLFLIVGETSEVSKARTRLASLLF